MVNAVTPPLIRRRRHGGWLLCFSRPSKQRPKLVMFSFSSYHPVLFNEAAAPPHDLLPDGNDSSFQLPRSYLHRSSSGQSLPLQCHVSEPIHPPYSSSSSSFSSSSCDYLDFKTGPLRRVLSAGDLQGMNCPNASHRVGRYSAEERKERIQRYRSKRNQRNFHKKITYACRKTLADSRPRVRGRFMRNEGMETETESEAAAAEAPNTVKLYSNDNHEEKERQRHNVDVDWRSHLQAALATEDEADSFYDEDLIASFADALSINLYS